MPHRFSSCWESSAEPPNLREQLRMQASTASACLRRLSDWVNSVSKLHACSLSTILDIFDDCPPPLILWWSSSANRLPLVRESSSASASREDASRWPLPC